MSARNHLRFDQHKALVEVSCIFSANRTISSIYGVDVSITAAQTIPYRAPKIAIQNMLSESNLMYSYLDTIVFLEWDIEHFLFGMEDVHG